MHYQLPPPCYPEICLSAYLSITLTINPLSVTISIYYYIYLSLYLSIALSIILSIYLCIYQYLCLSIYLSIYLSLFICQSLNWYSIAIDPGAGIGPVEDWIQIRTDVALNKNFSSLQKPDFQRLTSLANMLVDVALSSVDNVENESMEPVPSLRQRHVDVNVKRFSSWDVFN